MLHKIRKTTDSIVFRVFLGVIAIAFAWGYRDFVGGVGNKVIVSFKGVSPITFSEYSQARHEEITKLQRSEGISFTEEQIDEMNIPASVLQKLITNRLIKFLALDLDLDFSDGAVAEVIKKLPAFRDEENIFDIERFKTYLRMNNMSVEEYSDNVHDYLAQTIILGSFIGNSHVPAKRIENIINYMSEKRLVDIASISLVSNNVNPGKVSEDVLQNFYKENKDLFKSPWKRDICYLKINQQSAKEHIKVSENDISTFYKENKSEFENKKLDQVKDKIRNYLRKEKFDYWVASITKSLDDEVAAGSSLPEIAAKQKIQMRCEKDISAKNIDKKASGLFSPFLSDIYDMSEGEVSYPADLENGGVVLFEVTKYVPESFLDYAKVKNQVKDKYARYSHRQEKIKQIGEFAAKANSKNFVIDARSKNMQLLIQRPFMRSDMSEEATFPSAMIAEIFKAKKDVVVGPFIEQDKAYLFVLKNIGKDKKTQKGMKNDQSGIVSSIREGMSEELLVYSGQKSRMEFKTDVNSLKASKTTD